MSIKVSVIIPVYNAALFLRKAVISALELPQTAEIILVEDGSTDNSLEQCQILAKEFAIVKLYTHDGNSNKGAGASRNLGIMKSSSPYLAFLDADDFFLPNRFDAEEQIFSNNSEAEGVYGAMGFHFYSELAKTSYMDSGFTTKELTTIGEVIDPENLKWVLLGIIPDKGHFSIVALTVKKSLVDKSGLFPDFSIHEDTVFILQLALTGKLFAGNIKKPVAMRGSHENNRITKVKDALQRRVAMYKELENWAIIHRQSKELTSFLKARITITKLQMHTGIPALFILLTGWFSSRYLIKYEYFFNAGIARVFRNNKIQRFVIVNKERIQTRIFRSDSSMKNMLSKLGVNMPIAQ